MHTFILGVVRTVYVFVGMYTFCTTHIVPPETSYLLKKQRNNTEIKYKIIRNVRVFTLRTTMKTYM